MEFQKVRTAIKHKWEKKDIKWIITCVDTEKRFDPIIWRDQTEIKGMCPYCGADVELELEKRKRERAERERIENLKTEVQAKNTLSGWF